MIRSQGHSPPATRARPSFTYNHPIMYNYDPEGPDPSDLDRANRDDLQTCPECGAEVYADADRCPSCGHWVLENDGYKTFNLTRPHRNTKLIAAILLLLFLLPILWMTLTALFA